MMGWFKLYLSWIIISAVYVSCQELSSTLREGNHTCPGEEVNFTCTIRGSPSLTDLVLAWSSSEYIGQSNFLRFTMGNSPGTIATSIINGNVVATLINITIVNGVPVLESQLHIVADQNSTVTCDSVTNRSTASKEFFVSAVPGIPRDVRAVETAESTESDCIIVVTWDPPANTTDVDHYIVSVPSRNISENNKLLTTDPLRVRNCHNNISIHVAAVNHLGCEGQADVLASLLGTESAPNEPTTTTTNGPNNEGGSTISIVIAAVFSCVAIIVSIILTVVIVVVYIQCMKVRKVYSRLEQPHQVYIQFSQGPDREKKMTHEAKLIYTPLDAHGGDSGASVAAIEMYSPKEQELEEVD